MLRLCQPGGSAGVGISGGGKMNIGNPLRRETVVEPEPMTWPTAPSPVAEPEPNTTPQRVDEPERVPA